MGSRLQTFWLSIIITACILTDGSILHPTHRPPVERVSAEFTAGLHRRGIQGEFEQYRKYLASVLKTSRQTRNSGDNAGNCRLNWVDKLVGEPVEAIGQAERFTRELYEAVKSANGWMRILEQAAEKLDVSEVGQTQSATSREHPESPAE
ncbi:MAG: hypothetical protein ACRD2L_05715, partial [Terriglobia bacterium]